MKTRTKHKKISIELYNLLSTKEVFQGDNYKAIYCAFIFLQEISYYNRRNCQDYSEYYNKTIKDIFQISPGGYRKYLDALVELDLLLIDENYSLPTFKDAKDGHCKAYSITDIGNSLLYSSNRQYLEQLHTNKDIIQLNYQQISKSKVNNRTYNDYILDYIHDGLINMTFSYQEVIKCLDESDKAIEDKVFITNMLIKFKEKKFTKLSRNKADNRIWNEFVAMMGDYRKFFKYKNMTRSYIVDIRACHPTFWSSYIIKSTFIKSPAGDSGAEIHPELLSQHHNEGVSLTTLKKRLYLRAFKEHHKWVALFTNEALDPRLVIVKDCKYTCISDVKRALTETMNGSTAHPKITSWLKKKFPCLYSLWLKNGINIKRTGCQISQNYETVLLQDEGLYRLCDSLDIKITYEYDGVSVYENVGAGVFANDNDLDITDKVKCITEYIKAQSMKLFGVSLVMKIKLPVNEMLQASIDHDNSVKKARFTEMYADINHKYIKLIRNTKGGTIGSPKQLQKLWTLKDKRDYIKYKLIEL
jgi:hypothetical protein